MSLSNNKILKIYNSRNTIIDLLKTLNYVLDDYQEFSINEIDAMVTNDQLDMLVSNPTTNRKVYIKYFTNLKNVRKENLDTLIEDLFILEAVLTKNDILVVIVNEDPNDTIRDKIKYLYDHDGIFIVMHYIERLQFNILNHTLVPKSTILDETQTDELLAKYNLKNRELLPNISRFDPLALAICLKPGEVCQFERNSSTAINNLYYRVCI
jgi:DNA-directed RNA polymerase subunit H (RpoH/RPB5)